MQPLKFEPIAAKIARDIDIARLLPPVQETLAKLRSLPKDEHDFDENPKVEDFMAHYMTVVRGCYSLLGASDFRRLHALAEQIDEEYMPGGPPMSPVYDSYSAMHVIAEIPQGVASETPSSVIARLARGRAGLERVAEMARAIAVSHLDLYRARDVSATEAELVNARDGRAERVQLSGPFLRENDLILGRMLAIDGAHYMVDSPYLLNASEEDWKAYLARVSGAALRRVEGKPAGDTRMKNDKRSRKRRQAAQKATSSDSDAMVRHLRYGRDWRYWLDYVTDGYAGERSGIVFLAGVPDRPETLPHHADYDGPSTLAETGDDDGGNGQDRATDDPRPKLFRIAEELGLQAVALQALKDALERAGIERMEVQEDLLPLLDAVTLYGVRTESGKSALEHFLERGAPTEAERAFLEGVARGWFSLFEIRRIHLDEGFDTLDVLRGKALRIKERSATRQVAPRDLLAGWVYEDPAGDYRLEGGVARVPSIFAGPIVDLLRAEKLHMRLPGTAKLDWRGKAGLLPIPFIAIILALRAQGPQPRMLNTSGHELTFATARYEVLAFDEVRRVLERDFESNEAGRYTWLEGDTVIAHLELGRELLTVQVNSRERLAGARERLDPLLGSAVRPSLASIEGGAPTTHRPRSEPMELSPELQAAMHEMLLERLRGTLDEGLPAFGGKTLRQLARGKKSRPDAIGWLREQERLLRHNLQTASFDMRSIWQELGLEYQGLGTDPPR